jgi:hypothetical protein
MVWLLSGGRMINSEWKRLVKKHEDFEENVLSEHTPDNVNNPPHYGRGKIECIDYIQDFLTTEEYIGYLRGNIAKYLHRWRYKNKQEDLLKAQWYLERLIHLQGKE